MKSLTEPTQNMTNQPLKQRILNFFKRLPFHNSYERQVDELVVAIPGAHIYLSNSNNKDDLYERLEHAVAKGHVLKVKSDKGGYDYKVSLAKTPASLIQFIEANNCPHNMAHANEKEDWVARPR